MFGPVQLNMKTMEWGKPGKNGRIVCDLGTPASLLGGDVLSVMKDVLAARPTVVLGQEMHFIKSPDRNRLREAYKGMLTKNMFLYFSDDSTWSRRCTDGMLYVNLDLSSCDLSNGPAVFQYLAHLFPPGYEALGLMLIEQCRSPANLGHGTGRFRVAPEWYYEYSGTTLTTMLNCLANVMIGEQLAHIPYGSRKATCVCLEHLLKNCGWKVPFTVGDECERFEDITFLKTSPAYTVDGAVDSILNLGVILRTLGQKVYDLPGRGPMENRAYEFNSSLVRGFKHAGDTSLMELLKRKFRGESMHCVHESYTVNHMVGTDVGRIDDHSLCSRYRITVAELHCMLNTLEQAGFGDIIDTPASRAILKCDYGI